MRITIGQKLIGGFMIMALLVEEKGQGWVPYSWPKPGEEKSSPKLSCVVSVNHGSKNYFAGAGMYDVTPKNIETKFPGDAVYEDG